VGIARVLAVLPYSGIFQGERIGGARRGVSGG